MNITSSSVNWSSQPKKKAVNDKALEITDDDVLQEMKNKEHAAAEAKKKKEENKIERERRAKERLKEKERKKLEQEWKRLERAKEKKKGKESKKPKNSEPASTRYSMSPTAGLDSLFAELDVEEDNGQCSNCGMFFKDDQTEEQNDNRFWICCDGCDGWYCFSCHKFTVKDTVPDAQ